LNKLRQNKLLVLVLVIILCGILVRVYDLANTPKGFNQDEVSAAYEGYALLTNGTDRWGNPWPAYFLSWGSGQNVLLSYLDIPVFAVAGVTPYTVRLIPVLLGILTLPLMFLTARKLFNSGTALIATAMLAFAPWHVIASRWGLESNLLPFFLLLSVYTFLKALEDKRWIIWSLIPWAAALYAYSISLVFIPLILFLLVLTFWRKIWAQRKRWALAGLLFLLLATPITLMFIKNYLVGSDLPFEKYLPFSVPLFTSDRISSLPTGGIRPALKWDLEFFLTGFNDGSVVNSFHEYPAILPAWLLIILVPTALIKLVFDSKARKRAITIIPVFFVTGIALLILSLITFVNVNRINAIFLPLILLCAYGLYFYFDLIRRWHIRALTILVVAFSVGIWLFFSGQFISRYFNEYSDYSRLGNYPGLGEAIVKVTALSTTEGQNGTPLPVFIPNSIQLNYMFVLFYDLVSPGDFHNNAVIDDTVSVRSYRNFYFDTGALPANTGRMLFIDNIPNPGYCANIKIEATSGDWTIGSCDHVW
jgi:hypothetical protein